MPNILVPRSLLVKRFCIQIITSWYVYWTPYMKLTWYTNIIEMWKKLFTVWKRRSHRWIQFPNRQTHLMHWTPRKFTWHRSKQLWSNVVWQNELSISEVKRANAAVFSKAQICPLKLGFQVPTTDAAPMSMSPLALEICR